jgi:RimJ/RimL family protein N-acetyltransferase
VLSGEHVGLRAIERRDLEQLRQWRNLPEFRRNFREYREIAPEQQEAWYEAVLVDRSQLMFAIEALDDQRLLGACGLCYVDWVNRTCDLSIYIGDDAVYIDEVFAPDAARVALGYAFDVLGIHRVWVEIYEYDEVKRAFLEGLGFKLEGTHRDHHYADGRHWDSLFYGLLAPEWAASRPPAA